MAADIKGEPTNQDVLDAIDVLKRAGVNVTVDGIKPDATSTEETTARTGNTQQQLQKPVNPAQYMNQDYEVINMMLGGNNNNNDPMTNLLPYLMNQNGEGKNIDPQVLQSIMMNSMMNSLNGLNSTDNK